MFFVNDRDPTEGTEMFEELLKKTVCEMVEEDGLEELVGEEAAKRLEARK